MGVENRSPPEQLPIVLQVSPSPALPAGRTPPLPGRLIQGRVWPCDSAPPPPQPGQAPWGSAAAVTRAPKGPSSCRLAPRPRPTNPNRGWARRPASLPHASGAPMGASPLRAPLRLLCLSEAHGAQTTQEEEEGACANGAAAPGRVPAAGCSHRPSCGGLCPRPHCSSGAGGRGASRPAASLGGDGAGGALRRAARLPRFQLARVPAEAPALGRGMGKAN